MRIKLLSLVLAVSYLCGQDSYISTGLTLQYGDGTSAGFGIRDDSRVPYIYREHFLDITAGFRRFSVWLNLEFSSPPQIGPDYRGLRKARLSWEGERLSITMGDLYGQIGRGLALNLWENQRIDWDSSLRGFWIKGSLGEWLSFDLVSGHARGGGHLPAGSGVDPRVRDFSEDEEVNLASISRDNILRGLTLGAYLVHVGAMRPWFAKVRDFSQGGYLTVDSTSIRTRSFMSGIFGKYVKSNYDFYVELVRRNHRISNADSLFSSSLHKWLHYKARRRGWGGYASFSFYPGNWGLTIEYKNYGFDLSDPDRRRHLPFRLGRSSVVQSPPTAFREHTSVLLSRTPHVMDFDDEIGLQVEVNYEITANLFLLFNFAQSRRHSSFTQRVHPDFTSEWKSSEISNPFWMDAREKFYPFRELYGEINYHYDPLNADFKGMVSQSSELISYDASITERGGISDWLSKHSKITVAWDKRNLFTVPLELTVGLPSGWGLTLYWEHQWENSVLKTYIGFQDNETGATDSILTDGTTSVPYYYRYVALNVGKPSKFLVGITYDYASDTKTGEPQNVDPELDSWLEALIRRAGIDLMNTWFGVQFTGYLASSTILTLFYGSIQGGLKCDSGVCVYVPGIEDAFTLTLTSNF